MRILSALAGLLFLTTTISQASAQDLDALSLSDMLGLQSTIATKKALTTRESPGIVSIVTREEIIRTGARDLMEVLTLLVPGIYSATDIEGAAGIGIRGLWGFDSRMLLMIDGLEMNEEVFGSFVLGNHYPAEMIERVEVIRGPGSVIYGGFGTIGVINVISRGVDRTGVVAAGRYSQMDKSASHRNITLGTGNSRNDFKYDFTASVGDGNRGEGTYYDGVGNSASMTNRTGLEPQLYNLGLRYKGLSWRTIVDKFHSSYVHYGWGAIDGKNYRETWDTVATQLQYVYNVSDKFRLTPKYDLKVTRPWNIIDDTPPNGPWENRKHSTRHRAGVQADWDITSKINLLSGAEYSSLVVETQDDSKLDTELPVKNEFRTIFTEANFVSNAGRFIVGGRYEDSAIVDPAFVPRFGWTKAWDRLHSKFMVAQSFRSPAGIQPARAFPGDTLKPEIATNVEFETGYRITDNQWIVGNLFDIKVDDALVYTVIGAVGAYDNQGTIGSRGFEAEYRYKGAKFDLNSSIAYYRSIATSVQSLNVPGESGVHRSAAAVRVNVHGGWKITEDMGLFPTLSYYSERYGLSRDGTVKEFDPTVVANLNFRYQNIFTQGLQFTFGVMNLAGSDLPLLQGYDNGVAEMPNNQRAYNLMVGYERSF